MLFFVSLFSSFVPFRRYAPSSPYRSHQAWDLKRGCFFLCRIPYAVPCCLDLLFTHSVTNVTHSLGLGLRVFRPVLPVSLPFSRGSVPTLFDSTIYLHFNIFLKKKKVRRSSNHLGFRGRLFPWSGRTNTLHGFLSYVVLNSMLANSSRAYNCIVMARLSYSSPLFNTTIPCKLVYMYIYIFFSWTWFWPNVLIAKFPLNPFIAGHRSLASVAVFSIN